MLKGIQKGGYKRVRDSVKVNSSTDGKKTTTEKLPVGPFPVDNSRLPS